MLTKHTHTLTYLFFGLTALLIIFSFRPRDVYYNVTGSIIMELNQSPASIPVILTTSSSLPPPGKPWPAGSNYIERHTGRDGEFSVNITAPEGRELYLFFVPYNHVPIRQTVSTNRNNAEIRLSSPVRVAAIPHFKTNQQALHPELWFQLNFFPNDCLDRLEGSVATTEVDFLEDLKLLPPRRCGTQTTHAGNPAPFLFNSKVVLRARPLAHPKTYFTIHDPQSPGQSHTRLINMAPGQGN